MLFHLLDVFALEAGDTAPVIYKTLVFRWVVLGSLCTFHGPKGGRLPVPCAAEPLTLAISPPPARRSLIENYANETVRQFILANLGATLEDIPNIPVGLIVEPLIRQLSLNASRVVDYDFFVVLAKHKRLELSHALVCWKDGGGVCGRASSSCSLFFLLSLSLMHPSPFIIFALTPCV